MAVDSIETFQNNNEHCHDIMMQQQMQGILNGIQDQFYNVNLKWNSNQEVANVLYAAQRHPEWILSQSCDLPRSGSQYLFHRCDGAWFKNDKFTWKRRREGKLIREDHMRLKVNRQELISANYVHSAIVPTFHRRVYYLTNNPDIVMVHYLNTCDLGTDLRKITERIVATMQANGHLNPFHNLLEQLHSIYCATLAPTHITLLYNSICAKLEELSISQNQPSTSHGVHLERRNSCSSAFRKGLSSVALRRQPSTFSDSVDANYIGVVMNNFGADHTRDSLYGPPTDARSHSGETQRSSNQDEEMSVIHPGSISAVSASGVSSHSYIQDQPTGSVSEILDMAPSTSSTKGGTRVILIGDWYMKGHEYKISFGERQVPAKLIRPGVLVVTTPSVPSAGYMSLRVFCNNHQVSGTSRFLYEDSDSTNLHQTLIDRLHLIVAAFGMAEGLPAGSNLSDETSIVTLLRMLTEQKLQHPSILLGTGSLPSRTILHLAAQLDYSSLTRFVINWGRNISYVREFDPLARDIDGSTPLHVASQNGSVATARVLVECFPTCVDVLDDRGRTPCEVASDEQLSCITSRNSCRRNSCKDEDHSSSTALWVMTNGERVTAEQMSVERKRRGIDTNDSSSISDSSDDMQIADIQQPGTSGMRPPPLHVEISMDTDVHVPDSPKMADLFQAVTSPGVFVNDNTRQRMASLAKQIIDALPDRIKNDNCSLMDEDSICGVNTDSAFSFTEDHLSHMIANGDMRDELWSVSNYCFSLGQSTNPASDLASGSSFDRHLLAPSRSMDSSCANTFESSSFDRDLGEFFNIDIEGDVDPTIQQRLGDLKLSGETLENSSRLQSSAPDGEQREVYEAAMVIQRAYREYRERHTNRRQADVERRAAVTIQSCYRRYKQFCHFKKLLNAAIVVQKHFRLKKVNQRESTSTNENEVREHPTLEGQILRIQVPQNSSSLLREHRAATTIQAAYRGHRKRQAAARKIQKFMKESRMNSIPPETSYLTPPTSGAKRRRFVCPQPPPPVSNQSNGTSNGKPGPPAQHHHWQHAYTIPSTNEQQYNCRGWELNHDSILRSHR